MPNQPQPLIQVLADYGFADDAFHALLDLARAATRDPVAIGPLAAHLDVHYPETDA